MIALTPFYLFTFLLFYLYKSLFTFLPLKARASESALWWTLAAHTARTHTAWASESGALATGTTHLLPCLLASEEIELVDHVQHGVTVDVVVPCISTLDGVEGTAEVALLVEQVIELDAHGERFAAITLPTVKRCTSS